MKKPSFKGLKKYLTRKKDQFSINSPVKLPQTAKEMEDFLDKVFSLAEKEQKDSYVQAVAASIMHLPQTEDEKPLSYFIKVLRKAVANQASYEVIDALRQKEKAERQKREVTPENSGETIVESPQESTN